MGRVIHLRLYGLPESALEALHDRLAELAASRDWRSDRPWLADPQTATLFEMEFFRHAADAAAREDAARLPLSAAGFVRLGADETDALAVLFIARDLSERFGAAVTVRDPDNPIAKLREVDLDAGLLPDGAPLEAILVARPIFKKLPGAVIEMYPPRALASAFGTLQGQDERRRNWSFLVHGMRDTAPDFLAAEAEAMRIYRSLRFLS